MALLLSSLSACELAEIAAPQGEDLLVMESVLRAGDERQVVLLHRALGGRVVRGERDAEVVITGPDGAVRLREGPEEWCLENVSLESTDSLLVQATCYATENPGSLRVTPGSTYELRVRTSRGEEARGRTTVPGAFKLLEPPPEALAAGTCALPPATPLPLVWTPSAGAWSYLGTVEIYGLPEALVGVEAPERLELTGLAISQTDTTLIFPAEFGVFERFTLDQDLLIALQGGLPTGSRARLVIVAADRNFVNGVRGGGFNPSGNVRISSVVGDAIGVFGSLVPQSLRIEVGTALSFPDCR